MKQIIAFAGSNSKQSINKQLVNYTVGLLDGVNPEVLDLNDFDVPIFGVDLESSMNGQPDNAHKLLNKIKNADGLVISLAEHNGAYTSVFKNLFDWMSRIEGKTFFGKPMLLMATSTGARGGQSVLTIAQDRFPRHNADIKGVFSLPKFKDNFSEGKIINKELNDQLLTEIKKFKEAL
ncbi:NADPH-dependent FMN reductase [Gaetbulibacter sp. NE]|uniref:NADPH-dependent FMN reductase n=1 Tax=Gaetbulibacter sp. NE TaxID=2982307 RepID=UPI0021D213EE|nr:NAD(P)H-dependent oxidoreductase [Gaetbulibacter sp. NE]